MLTASNGRDVNRKQLNHYLTAENIMPKMADVYHIYNSIKIYNT